MYISAQTKQAYTEIDSFIELLTEEDRNKIPKKLRQFFKEENINYLNHETNLSEEETKEILGEIGMLTESDFKKLIFEVLSPINYNLMVTPKEVDYVIEKIGLLIGNGINKSLHKSFDSTK